MHLPKPSHLHVLPPLGLIVWTFLLPLGLLPITASATPAVPLPLRIQHRLPGAYPTDLCSNTTTQTTIPRLWSVQVHTITYSVPGNYDVPGTALFSVTNALTNVTNEIECALRYDSLCDVRLSLNGTLDINLQVLIEVAYVTVVETVSCGNETGTGSVSVSVGGMAEVYLGCDFEASPRRCWGEEGGWVDAEVLEEAPGGGTGG